MNSRNFMILLIAALAALMLACGGGGETAAYEYDDEEGTAAAPTAVGTAPAATAQVADAATLVGSVRLNGTPPAQPVVQMAADPACQAAHASPVRAQDVVIGPNGELANVFVWIKDYRGQAPAPAAPALLNQEGCQYLPHVSGVQVGQVLQIKNSDPTLHNVHALPDKNREFNIGQPVQGMVSEKVFDKPEVMVPFKCDVHNWMSSYIGVVPHPYFGTSDAQGSFQISNLPPGTYTLEAWHEKYGTQTQQVTVGPSEQKAVEFSFNAV